MLTVQISLVPSTYTQVRFFEKYIAEKIKTLRLSRVKTCREVIVYEASTDCPNDLVRLGILIQIYEDAVSIYENVHTRTLKKTPTGGRAVV